MSDTEEMVRLMHHASDLLNSRLAKKSADGVHNSQDIRDVVAMAYAQGILNMVAASAAAEGEHRVAGLLAALQPHRYGEWQMATDDAAPLTSAEIKSMHRFLTGLVEEAKPA